MTGTGAQRELPRLMLVTDRRRTRRRDLVDLVAKATAGGLRLVQIREPGLADDDLRELVGRLREKVPEDTRLVVNASARVARTMRTGLHLPARHPAVGEIQLHGQPLGRSIHDEEEMQAALADRPDYLVLGTLYRTESKPQRAPAGPALVERICRQVHPLPVYGIGGITVSRIPALIHGGAYGVAVCGALLAANDPQRVAEAMTLAIEVAVTVGQRPES